MPHTVLHVPPRTVLPNAPYRFARTAPVAFCTYRPRTVLHVPPPYSFTPRLPLQPLTNRYCPGTAPVPFCLHVALTTPYQSVPLRYRPHTVFPVPPFRWARTFPVPFAPMLLRYRACTFLPVWYLPTILANAIFVCIWYLPTITAHVIFACISYLPTILANVTFYSTHDPLQPAWCQFPVVPFVLCPCEEQSIYSSSVTCTQNWAELLLFYPWLQTPWWRQNEARKKCAQSGNQLMKEELIKKVNFQKPL